MPDSTTARAFCASSRDQGVKIAADTYVTEGLCKAPGGLVRVHLVAREHRIVDIEISGDFTCHPPAGIAGLTGALRSQSLSGPRLVQTITDTVAALGLEIPGVGPEHFAAAIAAASPEELATTP